MKLIVKYLKLEDVPTPKYQTPGASGIDLHSAEEVILRPGKFKLIRTGIALEIPKGYEGQIRPRSGLAANFGIGVLNSPGTIDSDYRGEIKVILFNFSNKSFRIKKGDRIAQLVFSKVYKVALKTTKRLRPTKRNQGGFGHTG
ncbi:MAG: dUTP diphosphatase [candidate division WOR-3 bacterium]|nr:dUTP diphosphatase [candidate division WOR-3 bacterium]MCX7756918.1 dUTP diphosphatase [candidate division WOR-3 bacterium]MDW7987654.1 dUTP diphosphatase [candidate division WOR-3 bacterium]